MEGVLSVIFILGVGAGRGLTIDEHWRWDDARSGKVCNEKDEEEQTERYLSDNASSSYLILLFLLARVTSFAKGVFFKSSSVI